MKWDHAIGSTSAFAIIKLLSAGLSFNFVCVTKSAELCTTLTVQRFVHKFKALTYRHLMARSSMHMRFFASVLLLAVLSVVALAQQPAAPPKTHLKVGDKAPEFTLRATDGKTYKLSDFKGQKNVVLAIYVLAFTGG